MFSAMMSRPGEILRQYVLADVPQHSLTLKTYFIIQVSVHMKYRCPWKQRGKLDPLELGMDDCEPSYLGSGN